MTKLVPLSSEQHGNLRAAKDCSTKLAGKMHVINMRANEIGFAAVNMPVFINRNQHTGQWALSALASFMPNQSLFVGKDGWQATWIPTLMQCHPLYLMNADNEKGYAVGIDPTSGDFTESDDGQPLFDATGQQSEYVRQVTQVLEDDIQQRLLTQAFLDETEKRELLRPLDLTLEFNGSEPQTITGLHTIDEDKLKALEGETLEALNKNGFLLLMYAMLTSINHINNLVRRHNATTGLPTVGRIRMEVAKSTDSGVAT